MPQSERANNLKRMVEWLASFDDGATVQAIRAYTKWDITEGGATDATIKKYIEDLDRGDLIEYKHPFWKVTEYGRRWLEEHRL